MAARIVIIEDNETNMELMLYLLQAFGHQPMKAMRGGDGIALTIKEQPDLVICDIQLPDIDGYEVVRQLKANPTTRKIPIVAVTALAMVGDRDNILAAGFDGYLSKPIMPEQFVQQVEEYIHLSARSLPPINSNGLTPSPLNPPTRARILIVDDREVNIAVGRGILEPNGIEIESASSVQQGLAKARAQPPDLILTDLHMPDTDGFEFIKALRADPQLQAIPVVIISSTIWNVSDKIKGLSLGAKKFLVRPIEAEQFLAEILECLSL
ncbi:MAG: response regulator [Acidobacteria bacterium]|nr:response regulator [Acidobacteriota bacterium]